MASLLGQINQLIHEHDGRGTSKKDFRSENLDKGAGRNEASRDKIFSTSTRQDFIDTNRRMAEELKAEFGIYRLGDIKPHHFDHYWNKHANEWATTTQATYLDHFKRLNTYIVQKGWGKGFIMDHNLPRLPKNWKSIKIRTDRALSWDSKSLEMYKKENPKHANIITLLRETGMRSIEMQRLKWSDVDLKNNVLNLNGKGGRPRTIPLSPLAKQILEKFAAKNGAKGKVFGHVRTNTLRKSLQRFNEKYNLPKRSLHSLRHLYAKDNFGQKYLENRQKGMAKLDAMKDARGYISHLLGHGRVDQDRGRISVTYSYLSGAESKEIMKEMEFILSML